MNILTSDQDRSSVLVDKKLSYVFSKQESIQNSLHDTKKKESVEILETVKT